MAALEWGVGMTGLLRETLQADHNTSRLQRRDRGHKAVVNIPATTAAAITAAGATLRKEFPGQKTHSINSAALVTIIS